MAMALHTPADHLTFNWHAKSNSHQRIARFVDYLFSRIDRLQAPGFDTKWKSISLAATVPGLTRFSAAQDGSNVWRICHIARSPAGPVLIYSSENRLRFMLRSLLWARANFNLD